MPVPQRVCCPDCRRFLVEHTMMAEGDFLVVNCSGSMARVRIEPDCVEVLARRPGQEAQSGSGSAAVTVELGDIWPPPSTAARANEIRL